MARGDAVFRRHPLCFEQGVLGEAHENRVESPGLEAGLAAQVVTIAPGSGAFDKPFEYTKCLGRYSWTFHGRKSIYIDILRQVLIIRGQVLVTGQVGTRTKLMNNVRREYRSTGVAASAPCLLK